MFLIYEYITTKPFPIIHLSVNVNTAKCLSHPNISQG